MPGRTTNHLDVEGVAQLTAHLNARFARPSASRRFLAVTHDRWFLDAVCVHITGRSGVDPGGDRPQIARHVEIYDGSYAAYTLARAELRAQADVAAAKRQPADQGNSRVAAPRRRPHIEAEVSHRAAEYLSPTCRPARHR